MDLLFENSNPSWSIPSIEEELGEIERTAEHLEIPLEVLLTAVNQGKLVILNNELWSQMENTDSWETTDMQSVERLGNEYERDVNSLVHAMKTGKTIPAPIVLIKPDGIPYLIGGNTRLMVARALGLRPKIFLITISC